jgi:hypothetical protein
MFNLNRNFPKFTVNLSFQQQKQIAFQTFFQCFILADKFLINKAILPDGDFGKVMCKEFSGIVIFVSFCT